MLDAIRQLSPRNAVAPSDHDDPRHEFDGLIGHSAAMVTLRRQLLRAARSRQPVLVTGPTGAGKELVVRALHRRGDGAGEPCFDLNCGAIPEPLIESQLFGHERGAFTGADRQREGCLAAVRGGTLFLDEVAELPPALQAKLLRVLETRRFRPVGALVDQPFLGRVVAATHVDLRARVAARQFREDLFYRLDVLRLDVPALDERRDDIARLVSMFAATEERSLRFTPDALQWLGHRAWPGNVRELKHFIHRVAVFCDDDLITAAVLHELSPETAAAPTPLAPSLRELARLILRSDERDKLGGIERALVDEALHECGGNKSAAAKLLGVHRKVVERISFARRDEVGR